MFKDVQTLQNNTLEADTTMDDKADIDQIVTVQKGLSPKAIDNKNIYNDETFVRGKLRAESKKMSGPSPYAKKCNVEWDWHFGRPGDPVLNTADLPRWRPTSHCHSRHLLYKPRLPSGRIKDKSSKSRSRSRGRKGHEASSDSSSSDG